MNKFYRDVVTYDPCSNQVTYLRHLKYKERIDPKLSTEAAKEVLDAQDIATEIVVGVTTENEIYQLSYASYKTYIKENASSTAFIDRRKLLTAIARYKTKKNMWEKDPFD